MQLLGDGKMDRMSSNATRGLPTTLLAGLLVTLALSGAQAKQPEDAPRPDQAGKRQPTAHPSETKPTSAGWHSRRGLYYQRKWGVDIVGVRPVSSGYMLRFNYRVVDPEKAAALNNRRSRPYLIDEKTRTALAVPAMEKIGELRQVSPPELNRIYFMIFGNPGRLVKSGSRVTIVVGNFRAEGLVVD